MWNTVSSPPRRWLLNINNNWIEFWSKRLRPRGLNLIDSNPSTPLALLCKAKRQYLLTCEVSRYCLLALHGRAVLHFACYFKHFVKFKHIFYRLLVKYIATYRWTLILFDFLKKYPTLFETITIYVKTDLYLDQERCLCGVVLGQKKCLYFCLAAAILHICCLLPSWLT